MEKISKIASITMYSFITAGIIFIIFMQFNGIDKVRLPISLGYVYSGSMEPTIKTNDGYILIQSKSYGLHDIITFRPKVLKETYVTHRIIEEMGDHKFRTQGDNNQSTDQEGGEPFVGEEQIEGKILTINGKPIIIPKLGIISKKFNVYILISIGVGLYLIGYLFDSYSSKHKRMRSKRRKQKGLRVIHISSYFDPVFITVCAVLLLNAIFIGFTLKSSNADQTSFTVVNTIGIGSPNPGETFTSVLSLENKTLIPFIVFLEPENASIIVTPPKLPLRSNQHNDYKLIITAPQKIGHYTETINKTAYPNVLPSLWMEYMYNTNKLLPFIVIFAPGILLNFSLFIWWLHRSQLGRRKVYEWLIPLRKFLRN